MLIHDLLALLGIFVLNLIVVGLAYPFLLLLIVIVGFISAWGNDGIMMESKKDFDKKQRILKKEIKELQKRRDNETTEKAR